ncbi:MAG: tetratricopeptide repeat protein [Proteobacteria bacterium]|nr:tetratricopeptide repeat protein [Pseudomonadota bacterium]
MDAGKRDEAQALLVAALAAPPASADQALALGQLLTESGDLERALSAYELALQLEPTSTEAPGMVGVTLLALGRADEGLDQLREAARRAPGQRDVSIGLAKALLDHGRHEEATEYLQQALQLDPSSSRALVLLGHASCRLERWDEGVEVLRKAVALSPGDPEARLALGVALAQSGATMEAVETFEALLATAWNPPVVLVNLGLAVRQSGDLRTADRHLREAVRLAPSFAQARTNLGVNLLEQGSVAEAVVELTRATELDPQGPDGFYNLGLALEREGEIARARAALEQAAALSPGDASIDEKLASLRIALPTSEQQQQQPALSPLPSPGAERNAAATGATESVRAATSPGLPRAASSAMFVGTLETFSIPELLEFFRGGRRTGVLFISADSGAAEVHLRGGKVVAAAAPGSDDLAELLRARAGLSDDQLGAMLATRDPAASAARLGELVQRSGMIPEPMLEEAVVQQIKSAIGAVLGWTQGNFAFDPGAVPSVVPGLELDVGQLLLAIMCQHDDAEQDWAEGGGL